MIRGRNSGLSRVLIDSERGDIASMLAIGKFLEPAARRGA
jgi:hypothetical protein